MGGIIGVYKIKYAVEKVDSLSPIILRGIH